MKASAQSSIGSNSELDRSRAQRRAQHANLQVAKRKIALLGFSGVGKTALATRFVQGSFVDMYSPTITNTFHTTVNFGKKTLTTEILDTAGLVSF